MNTEHVKIYVDVDSLFDTRQGILSALMPRDNLSKYVGSEEFIFREKDEFPVNMEEYNKLYNTRPAGLLGRSTITNILNVLRSKINTIESRNKYYNENKAPEVVLNIYPYEFTSSELDQIRDMLFISLNTKCYITIIRKRTEDITPYFIKGYGIIVCLIYDISTWINSNITALDECKMADLLVYSPTLHKGDLNDKEIQTVTKLGFKSMYSYLEYTLSRVVRLSFLPTLFYSNITISKLYIDKYNEELKKTKMEDTENGDISE